MEADARRATIAGLRARLAATLRTTTETRSAEIGPLTTLLGSAWRSGGTVELVGPEPATLMLAAWLAARREGPVVLIDSAGDIAPQGLMTLGLDPRRLVMVRSADKRLALWTAEQALRCPAVAATLCRIGPRLATTAARRLKLAAEAGGGMGFVVRSSAREPPFADARLKVRPIASASRETLCPRWEAEALYVRNGTEGLRRVVEVTADASLVLIPAELARATGSCSRVGG